MTTYRIVDPGTPWHGIEFAIPEEIVDEIPDDCLRGEAVAAIFDHIAKLKFTIEKVRDEP